MAVLRSGKKICVVLLDLMMPVMNGWEFRKHQLDDPALANIPVVVITAGSDGRGLGDVVLLTKPLALETILAHVHAIC